jgi:hypothetical protein
MSEDDALRQTAAIYDSHAAYAALQATIAEQYAVPLAEVQEFYTPTLLNLWLTKRRRMEVLWPDAPSDRYVYASFCRLIYDYSGLPVSAEVRNHPANWAESTPHSYIATLTPLDLPQVELLRRPAT